MKFKKSCESLFFWKRFQRQFQFHFHFWSRFSVSVSEWGIKLYQRLNKRKFLCHLTLLHILNSSCSQFTVLFPRWNSVALSPCRTIVAVVAFVWMKTILKLWKMLFISTWKLFQFLKYLIFYPHFWPCRKATW